LASEELDRQGKYSEVRLINRHQKPVWCSVAILIRLTSRLGTTREITLSNGHHHDGAQDRQQPIDWREHGVKVIPGDSLDPNTAQTPGMNRATAINRARAGAEKIWAGTVVIHANAKTGAHHHGDLESIIYVVKGRARMRWGEKLEFVAEAGPGDFIFVPPYVPHQEINASPDEALECVLVRSGQDPVVVNLDIEPVEKPEGVLWKDPIHR
jgi:uncharacterized RmlC-like cupin family protein